MHLVAWQDEQTPANAKRLRRSRLALLNRMSRRYAAKVGDALEEITGQQVNYRGLTEVKQARLLALKTFEIGNRVPLNHMLVRLLEIHARKVEGVRLPISKLCGPAGLRQLAEDDPVRTGSFRAGWASQMRSLAVILDMPIADISDLDDLKGTLSRRLTIGRQIETELRRVLSVKPYRDNPWR